MTLNYSHLLFFAFLGISNFMEILQEELDYRKNNPKTREILKDVSESIKKTEETAEKDPALEWRGPWLDKLKFK